MINCSKPVVYLSAPNAKGYRIVRIRVSFNGRVDLYPKVSIKDDQWDKTDKRVRHGCRVNGVLYSTLNRRINDCLEFIQKYCDNAQQREDETACANELKRQYNAMHKQTPSQQSNEFYYRLNQYIEKRKKEKGWSDKYYEQWVHLAQDLHDFRPHLKFSELGESTMMAYITHLSKRMSDEKMKEYLKKIREFVTAQKKNKVPINPEFYDFKPKFTRRRKEVAFLHPEEVQRIISLDYSHKRSLDRVRDMFIFQCCTSLRFSDMQALTFDNIRKNEKGNIEVQLVTRKDKGLVWFELNSIALSIYQKYQDYHFPGNRVFKQISSTNYRKFLHVIGQDACITGEVKTTNFRLTKRIETIRKRSDLVSHDARRTFIVTAINGGASPDEISLYTSHAEVQQMLPYLTISEAGKARVNSIIASAFS